jgi:hypothetical protein
VEKMLHRGFPRKARAASVGLAVLLGGVLIAPTGALADEGGVSFWIPGFYGSLAAAPLQPGLSVTAIDYYDSVKAGGDVARSRDITIRGFNTNLNLNINANLEFTHQFRLRGPELHVRTALPRRAGNGLDVGWGRQHSHDLGRDDRR